MNKKKQHAISRFFKQKLEQINEPIFSPISPASSSIKKFTFIQETCTGNKDGDLKDKEVKVEPVLIEPEAAIETPVELTTPEPALLSKRSKDDSPESLPEELFSVASTDTVNTPVSKRRKTAHKSTKPVPKSKSKKLTPLENQILELKQQNQDKLLLIQVGYKYKLYGEDAKIAAKILNIMYICKDPEDETFAYCSFPDFKLHINLKRLLSNGYKIGVVKQMESALINEIEKTSKSGDLMKRKVTGVYTKGTYLGDEFEESNGVPDSENQSTYIIAIHEVSHTSFTLVAVQPLTGEIVYDTFEDNLNRNEMETRLLYLNPSEVVIISEGETSWETTKLIKSINADVSIKNVALYENVLDELTGYFANIDPDDEVKYIHLIEYYSVNFATTIQICMNELIKYLAEFKLSNVFTIVENIVPFTNNTTYMVLPSNTLQALEIFENATDPTQERGTLTWLLDHTRTKFGKRQLRKWISRPLIESHKIEERQQAIADLSSEFNYVVDSIKNFLQKLNLDLEELMIKIHYTAIYKTSRINRKEVYLMLDCFNELLKIVKKFESAIVSSSFKSSLLTTTLQELLKMSKTTLIADLLQTINASFMLVDQKDATELAIQFFNLDYKPWPGIVQQKKEIENIEELLEKELEKVAAELKRPKMKYITCNREPYLIEVRNGSEVDKLPHYYQRVSGTKAVSRVRTVEINRLYKLLQYHQELLINNCGDAFNEFLQEIDTSYFELDKIVKHLSTFDCLLSMTAASIMTPNCIRPDLAPSQVIQIKNGRNPIIESLQNVHHYVANNTNITYDNNRVLIITGPNMGGKSSYVKQVALLVLMTQIGCYIPCDSAKMGIFDSIFIRMGASDNILKGNSTFMTEMLECSQIIKRMSSKSLVILDEIGRGTGTSDGISIAYSILNYLIETQLKPLVLFITHYPSLHVLEDTHKGIVTNFHMGFQQIDRPGQKFPEVIFLYSLVNGVVNNLYGLNVAKLAGIPSDIITSAYEVSEKLKNRIEMENIESLCKKIKSFLTKEDTGKEKENGKLIELFELIQ